MTPLKQNIYIEYFGGYILDILIRLRVRLIKKRGQATGGQAAALVGIITLILIFYILFLPPEERRELLYEDGIEQGGSVSIARGDDNVTLLSLNVGRLDYFPEKDFSKEIPNFYLDESTEGMIITQVNPFTIRNGWFDKQTNNFSITFTDLENTENILLSFAAKKHIGTLRIELNNQVIYESDIDQYNVAPINLEKRFLTDTSNIKFAVSGVGAKFWTTNEYLLEDIKITADVTDISRRAGGSLFTLSPVEFNNLLSSKLHFVPYCSQVEKIGRLIVHVNNKEIFAGIPVCDDPYRVPIPVNILNPGENTVQFRTEQGSYSVEQVVAKGDLKEVKALTNYFEINTTQYNNVVRQRNDVFLSIDFIDNDEEKEAVINVNGHLTYLDQRDPAYKRNIRNWILDGNNYITIEPQTTLDIVNMEIVYE